MAGNPGALVPIYTTASPDDAIDLFRGRLSVQQGTYTAVGDGTLRLIWTTWPKLIFEIPSIHSDGPINPATGHLTIPALGGEAKAHISRVAGHSTESGLTTSLRGQLA